jgi:type I restriction enzyme, R subunit
MKDLNEAETRRQLIDKALEEQGWDVNNLSQVRVEIDSKQSNFNKRDYKDVDETLKNDEESKYIDYLLLDKKGDPIAIIEAKRTSKDPIAGKKQAEEYAQDIYDQTGKSVFIFLTNGYEMWYWNWNSPIPYESIRMVKGFFGIDALERKIFQNGHPTDFSKIKLDTNIIGDRNYQHEAVRRVLSGIEKGRRKFLLVMATGTGKTRVAMATIKALMDAKKVQKVLFLTDRKSLRDQAFTDGYKKHLKNESRQKIFTHSLDKNSSLYVSTIQTFMENYQDFSPGDFDLIFSDEAHRSIYNKWKDVFTYFDSIKIGLTATPNDFVERDTFDFFECIEGKPTYLYDYEEAVDAGYLVQYKIWDTQTYFQREGVRKKDVPKEEQDRLLEEQGISPDEINYEGSEIEKKVIVSGTNESIMKEFYENGLHDDTGLPCKTIVFAISKAHAKRLWEAFEKQYPEHKSKMCSIITSDDSRAQNILEDFKKKSFPRIAISVDMLDTGVDIPEVCNLVIAKPVYTRSKFWQMIGRGTRNQEACEHLEWLPNQTKDGFLIFDFWKNFDWFDIHPKGRKESSTVAIPARVFLLRVQQYNLLKGKPEGEVVLERIKNDIELLPKDSVSIKEKKKDIDLALSDKLWKNVGIDGFTFLKNKITPLMRYKKDVNLQIESFVLKTERLGLAIIEKKEEEIERLKESIVKDINCLPTTIREVKKHEDYLDEVVQEKYWEDISYEDYLKLLNTIAPLMKYKRSEPVPKIIIKMSDKIAQRKLIEFGPTTNPKQEYVEKYKKEVTEKIKKIAKTHPTINKIKNGEALTEKDIERLEETLNTPDLYVTEESLRKAYDKPNSTITQFIKFIIGLYEFPNSEKIINEAFKTYMIEHTELSPEQINFLIVVKNVFLESKHIELKDFYDYPFTNIEKAPKPLFTNEQLIEVTTFCNKIEKEIG